MTDSSQTNDDALEESSAQRSTKHTSFPLWGKILTGLGILILLPIIFLPATRQVRPSAIRLQCASHLKQIALALHQYHHAHKMFPPAYTVDSNGKKLHSWRTLILPYLDAEQTYLRLDLSKAWDDPANAAVYKEQTPLCFRCHPDKIPANHTTYMVITTPDSCFPPDQQRCLSEITDAQGQTLLVIETPQEHSAHWMSPVDADEQLLLSLGSNGSLPHPGGINVAFADGHVEFLGIEIPADERRAWISIAGTD